MVLKGLRNVLRPAVELGEIESGQGRAGGEQRGKVGAEGEGGGPLVPADEPDGAEARPERGEGSHDGGIASVDGEGGDAGEGLGEAGGDKDGLLGEVVVIELRRRRRWRGLLVVKEEGMVAPGREKGEVEVSNGGEAGGEEKGGADVAAEDEGRARGPLQGAPPAAGERHGVAAADVAHQREDVRQDWLRQIMQVDAGGGSGGHLPIPATNTTKLGVVEIGFRSKIRITRKR